MLMFCSDLSKWSCEFVLMRIKTYFLLGFLIRASGTPYHGAPGSPHRMITQRFCPRDFRGLLFCGPQSKPNTTHFRWYVPGIRNVSMPVEALFFLIKEYGLCAPFSRRSWLMARCEKTSARTRHAKGLNRPLGSCVHLNSFPSREKKRSFIELVLSP